MSRSLGTRGAGRAALPARAAAGAALALVLLTLFAYAPVRHNGFLFHDDEDYVTRNSVVRRGITAEGLRLALTRSYAANWFPLTWLSHMVDVELFGLDPRGHHLMGLGLHTVSAVLLLLTLRAMTGRAGPSLLVAAIFAVHPLHVESVAWAAERKDQLSGLLWTATIALHLRYVRRPSPRRYLAALLSLALGLMAKQILVTLPLVLLALDWWPLGRFRQAAGAGQASPPHAPAARLVAEKLPFLLLSLLAGLVSLKAQATSGAMHTLETVPLGARVATALLATVAYVAKMFWPLHLAVFYPLETRSLAEPAVAAAALTVAAACAVAWRLRDSRPWLAAGTAWYLLALAPVSGLLQAGEQAMADRYTYVPLTGLGIALAWALQDAGRRHRRVARVFPSVAAAALAVLAVLTRGQVRVWESDETLFRHAIDVTGENWKATYSLAMAVDAAGDREGALRLYRQTIRLQPGFSRAHYSYALALDEAGSTAEALAELRAAVRAAPRDPVIRTTLALTLAREGLDEEAIGHLRELIALRPGVAEGYNNLAALLARRNQTDEAVRLLRRALEVDPSYADARANLEALTGERPRLESSPPASPGVPTTHRGLFGIQPRQPQGPAP